MPQSGGRTLVMTVGTGDLDRLEETLFTPLRKSIATEAWVKVVLLPSRVAEDFARALGNRIGSVAVEISPLPVGDENNADSAYAHFDGVLAKIMQNTAPQDVVVDFTRGTKAMSAALVLAATRRAVPRLRYVTGPRDRRGVVDAGSETVREIRTTAVDGHRRLDLARQLMRRGNFAAVASVLPDSDTLFALLCTDDFVAASRSVSEAARFYTAWDRLAYGAAAQVRVGITPSDEWQQYWPTPEAFDWVDALKGEPTRSDHGAMAVWLRRLAVDMLANGERVVELQEVTFSGQRSTGLIDDMRIAVIPSRHHGADAGGCAPAG